MPTQIPGTVEFDNPNAIALGERKRTINVVRPPVPEIEWWDAEFLPEVLGQIHTKKGKIKERRKKRKRKKNWIVYQSDQLLVIFHCIRGDQRGGIT